MKAVIVDSFSSDYEDVKSAASYALGKTFRGFSKVFSLIGRI